MICAILVTLQIDFFIMASKIDSLEETVKPVNDKPPDNVENQFGEASSIDKVTLNNTVSYPRVLLLLVWLL